VRFGRGVALAEPECASEVQEKGQFEYSVMAHSNSKSRVLVRSQLRAMIFELGESVQGSTTVYCI
jgi:hypothetical protein